MPSIVTGTPLAGLSSTMDELRRQLSCGLAAINKEISEGCTCEQVKTWLLELRDLAVAAGMSDGDIAYLFSNAIKLGDAKGHFADFSVTLIVTGNSAEKTLPHLAPSKPGDNNCHAQK